MSLDDVKNVEAGIENAVDTDIDITVDNPEAVNFDETLIKAEVESFVQELKNNSDYEDPDAGPRLSELLKNGDYVKAVTKLFNFIGVLFNKGMAGSSHEAFSETGADIDFAGMGVEKLNSYIDNIEEKFGSISSITRSLHLTSMLSRAKDSLAQKEKGIDAKDKYGLLAANVKVGDVLLINKRRDTSFGTQALRGFEEKNPADYGHSVLVSNIDPVMITHSTGHKESGPGSGVEETLLEAYFEKEKHVPSDVLVLNQNDPERGNSLEYAKKRIGK